MYLKILILCLVVMFIFSIFYYIKKIDTTIDTNTKTNTLPIAGRTYTDLKSKSDCENNTTYCWNDSDCNKLCTKTGMSCLNGICSTNIVITSDVENECNPNKGFIAYYTGNPAFGDFEYICKTIDPAIAISVDENRMCYGQDISIDYLDTFPQTTDCTCGNQMVVHATKEKREHIECTNYSEYDTYDDHWLSVYKG